MNSDTRVFVDGNNVMGSRPDGWWRDRNAAARRLIAELKPVARGCGGKWTIVFDGFPSVGEEAEKEDAVTVEYALRQDADAADNRIVELIAALPERTDVLVYTSDRRLRERVTALSASVQGARVLLELAAASRPREEAQDIIADYGPSGVGAARPDEPGTDGNAA